MFGQPDVHRVPLVIRALGRINNLRLVSAAAPFRTIAWRLAWLMVGAALVCEPGSYVLNSVRPSRQPRVYHLRSTRSRLYLRHHTGDIAIFRKFAADRDYDFPDEILDRLGRRPINVVDLGAHIGLFGVHVKTRFPLSSMVSFEPDDENAAVLAKVIESSGGQWELIHACASNRDGETTFAGGRSNLSRIADSGCRVPLRDAVPYLVKAELAKVNIEGAEWEILADDRFVANPPPVLILEYHRIGSPEPNFHRFAARLLTAAGYDKLHVVNQSETNGLVWAWQSKTAPEVQRLI
jgi:FkbM family methyltransferase